MSIQQRVYGIVSQLTGVRVEEITPEMRVLHYIDSPDGIEFIMELEEEFDFSIPIDEEHEFETVGQAIWYIEEHIEARSAR